MVMSPVINLSNLWKVEKVPVHSNKNPGSSGGNVYHLWAYNQLNQSYIILLIPLSVLNWRQEVKVQIITQICLVSLNIQTFLIYSPWSFSISVYATLLNV